MTTEENTRAPAKSLQWLAAVIAVFAAMILGAVWLGNLETGTLKWTNTDFSNYWIASRLVLEGEVLDLFTGQDNYFRHMLAAFGEDYPWHNWSYPPSFLLMIWPLGLLPHATSMVIFLALTAIVFLHSVSVFERRIAPPVAALLVAFIICNLVLAQNGFLMAALMLYGLGLRDRSPIWAGIAFGLLTVKPQLGILVPIVLLFGSNWVVIGSAAITALLLAATSVLLFGIDSWRGYAQFNLPYQASVMTDFSGTFLFMMPSLFGSLRSLGIDSAVAMKLHLVFASVAFILFLIGLVRLKDAFARSLLLLVASFLISPYSLVYDMGALSAVAAIGVYRSEPPWARHALHTRLLRGVALLPILHFVLSASFGLPIAPLFSARPC